MITKCYCDASYDPQSKTAVVGYTIGTVFDPIIFYMKNTKNTRAEIHGLIKLINVLDPNRAYIIYTDCDSILKRIKKRDDLMRNQFKNRKGKLLKSADLYRQLFDLVSNNLDLDIRHIRGHMPTHQKNDDDMMFGKLDKFVRAKLRSVINNN